MLSNASINLSNVSPAESSIPLPIPRPATLATPAMSPRTTQATLTTNADIDAQLLRTIANGLLTTIANGLLTTIVNGLLTTIANWETDTTMQYWRFTEQIQSLQDRILHYKQTFERAPEGYTLNEGRIPHFRIPHGDGLSCPAKWIKLNNDGTASGFTNTDGPSTTPHIIDLYTHPTTNPTKKGRQNRHS